MAHDTQTDSPRVRALIEAVRPLADAEGVFADSFRVNAALEAAGFDRSALFAAWLAGVGGIETVTVPGTFGHLHYKIPTA